MCGIVGIAGDLPAAKIERALKRMNEAIVHRGPDDDGLWAEDGFGFAMRRLSIIDLDTGSQPMWDKASGFGLVYNGETYNYKELREHLQTSGEQFETTSDTEVVLKSLVRHGENALQNFNGMYGAALWNSNAKELLLFRDRMGIKPLYYSWDGYVLVFASEIKAILASQRVTQEINPQSVWDYLTLRYVPGPNSIWSGINKLPPGHLLRWNPAMTTPEIEPYWKLRGSPTIVNTDIETSLEEFEELFLDAVEKRLVAADVPVGVLLSGGLDSSAVAAAAIELGHKDFHTFSVGFKGYEQFSELPYAREMAAHIGAHHHEIELDQEEFLQLLPEMAYAADEPLADLASIPLLAVSRLAREYVKVVLSGEGSDEVLGGYNFEHRVRKWETIRKLQSLPGPLRKAMSIFAGLLPASKGEALKRALQIPLREWNTHFPPHMTGHWSEQEKAALWPTFKGKDTLRIVRELYARSGRETPLDQMLYVYQRDWMVEDLLMKADKMTMYASLELRVPFLDYRLVEWAARQPRQVKVGPFGNTSYVTKNVLRRFATKRLPKAIIDRPKQGFPVPAYTWMKGISFRKAQQTRILNNSLSKRLFSAKAIQETFASAASMPHAAHNAWLLSVLACWHDQYSRPGTTTA